MKKKSFLLFSFLSPAIITFTVLSLIVKDTRGQSVIEVEKKYNALYVNLQVDEISLEEVKIGKKGSGTIMMVTLKKVSKAEKHPPYIIISVNDQVVILHDNGAYPDKVAGDGKFSVFAKSPAGNNPTTISYVKRGNELIPQPGANNEKIKIVCKAKVTTDCPPGCRGGIFGGPCILCVKVECELIFETVFGDVKGTV